MNILSPHGKQKHVARWVVERYDGKDEYKNNPHVQRWIAASKEVLVDPNAKERQHLGEKE